MIELFNFLKSDISISKLCYGDDDILIYYKDFTTYIKNYSNIGISFYFKSKLSIWLN